MVYRKAQKHADTRAERKRNVSLRIGALRRVHHQAGDAVMQAFKGFIALAALVACGLLILWTCARVVGCGLGIV